MSSYFIITFNGLDISFKTSMSDDLLHLGEFLVQKIKPFSKPYNEADILSFVLNLTKEFNWEEGIVVSDYEYLYTIDFDEKHPDFIIEHQNKKSEFKFYVEDIPSDWYQDVLEWINSDDTDSENESQSESENESENEQE